MTMRNVRIIEIFSVKFALVDIKKETTISAAAMKKQLKQYEEALKCPVAYEIIISSLAMRNALIKNRISFIDIPGNLFLELMYMDDNASALKSEIAGKLGITKTSITRATAQLEEMGLIRQNKSGTEISAKRNLSRKERYEKAKKYLINLIQKIVAVTKDKKTQNTVYAGYTALSQMSMLNLPIIEEAAYKTDKEINQFETADERLEKL